MFLQQQAQSLNLFYGGLITKERHAIVLMISDCSIDLLQADCART